MNILKDLNLGRVLACAFVMLLLVSIVSAATAEEKKIYWGDTLNYFLEDLPVAGSYIHTDSDDRLMQFYPIAPWEIDICTKGVTSMMANQEENKAFMSDASVTYIGIAVAISASKYEYDSNETLYSYEWYVLPEDKKIKYSIYLRRNTVKFYIPGYVDEIADVRTASSGYMSEYYMENYTQIGIEYLVQGALTKEHLEADIVPDTLDTEAKYD